MKLCRVTGNVVQSVKHPSYVGHKLMCVQPIDERGDDLGASLLAIDLAQAGPGDRVLVMQEGNGIRQILKAGTPPIQAVIIGIVDDVEVAEEHS